MTAYKTYDDLDIKFDKLLSENGLEYEFKDRRYPLLLTVHPDRSLEGQMSLYAAEQAASSSDASLQFFLAADGVQMRIKGRLYIEEALLNKIKNLAKKMVTAYLYGNYAEQFARNGDDIHYSGQPDDLDDDGESEDDGK